MLLGRVIGRVWCTVKNPGLEGQRLLVVQPLTPEGKGTGKPLVCADCTGAGAGETVYYTRGREASYAFLPGEVPSDNTIVAIVDEVHLKRGAPC
jgi:microcompartment protein CcmK/EutM